MQFVPNLQMGHLIRRYKRFFVDIQSDNGALITAHCANTGPMTGLLEPGQRVAFSYNPSKNRTLHYTWEMVFVQGTWIGTNTHRPNQLIQDAFDARKIDVLSDYGSLYSEVSVGNSRLDFYATQSLESIKPRFTLPATEAIDTHNSALLEHASLGNVDLQTKENSKEKGIFIEVKNVHFMRNKIALFPDTVTTRGAKHLRTLTQLSEQNWQTMMIYVIQRNDCTHFSIASDVDPDYAQAFQTARSAGVMMMAYACEVSLQGIILSQRIPITDPL